MDTEFDCDLTPDQWETLKALRKPAPLSPALVRRQLDSLVALELVAMCGDFPAITERGRKVLVRGSSRLLDVNA